MQKFGAATPAPSKGRNWVFQKFDLGVEIKMFYCCVTGPQFTKIFSSNVERIVPDHTVVRIFHNWIGSEGIRDRNLTLSEVAPKFARFCPFPVFEKLPQMLGPSF